MPVNAGSSATETLTPITIIALWPVPVGAIVARRKGYGIPTLLDRGAPAPVWLEPSAGRAIRWFLHTSRQRSSPASECEDDPR